MNTSFKLNISIESNFLITNYNQFNCMAEFSGLRSDYF